MAIWARVRGVASKRLWSWTIICAICILACGSLIAPFYYSKPPNSTENEIRYAHDLTIHLAVMEQFDKVLRTGTLYPRWLPDVNYGYGNAWPNFYPPGFYYLASLINAFIHNWINTLFVVTTLGLAGSCIAFYVLARSFFGTTASIIGAGVYALMPYHLIDFFWRGAMPEFLSFILLPLVLYFFLRVGRRGGLRSFAGLGLCYGLTLMLHTPIAYLFSYLLILYALMWAIYERSWTVVARVFAGMSLGVMLSAVYWLPAVLEIRYAVETVTTLFQYPRFYVDRLATDGTYEKLLRQTLAVQSMSLVSLISIGVYLRWRRGSNQFRISAPHVSIWAALGIIAAFMNLSYSDQVARLIPKIEVVAFPSRWLAFVCLFGSLLTADVAQRLIDRTAFPTKKAQFARLSAAAVALVAAGSVVWFSADAVLTRYRLNPMVVPYTEFLCDTYCPKGTGATANLPRTSEIQIDPDTNSYELLSWEPLYRKALVRASETTQLRFRTFNFPGWSAKIDGQPADIASDSSKAQLVTIPPGEHVVESEFATTKSRIAGSTLTIAGLLAVVLLIGTNALRWTRQAAQVPASPDFEVTRYAPRALFGGGFLHLVWAAVCLAGLVFSAKMVSDEFKPDTRLQEAAAVARPAIAEGGEANLSAGNSKIVVARDEQSLSAVLTAIARRDDPAITSMVQDDRCFRVAPNTRVRVLRLGSGKAKVAVLEGEYSASEGWVLEGWLR